MAAHDMVYWTNTLSICIRKIPNWIHIPTNWATIVQHIRWLDSCLSVYQNHIWVVCCLTHLSMEWFVRYPPLKLSIHLVFSHVFFFFFKWWLIHSQIHWCRRISKIRSKVYIFMLMSIVYGIYENAPQANHLLYLISVSARVLFVMNYFGDCPIENLSCTEERWTLNERWEDVKREVKIGALNLHIWLSMLFNFLGQPLNYIQNVYCIIVLYSFGARWIIECTLCVRLMRIQIKHERIIKNSAGFIVIVFSSCFFFCLFFVHWV